MFMLSLINWLNIDCQVLQYSTVCFCFYLCNWRYAPVYFSIPTLPPYFAVLLKQSMLIPVSEDIHRSRKLFLTLLAWQAPFHPLFSLSSIFLERLSQVALSELGVLCFPLAQNLVYFSRITSQNV